jgi:hypothetical protein
MQMEIKIPIVIDDKALEEAIDKRVAELKQDGDFVLVTRCKDCKYWLNGYCREGIPFCGDDASYVATEENDFCSYAEQKEIEGE